MIIAGVSGRRRMESEAIIVRRRFGLIVFVRQDDDIFNGFGFIVSVVAYDSRR